MSRARDAESHVAPKQPHKAKPGPRKQSSALNTLAREWSNFNRKGAVTQVAEILQATARLARRRPSSALRMLKGWTSGPEGVVIRVAPGTRITAWPELLRQSSALRMLKRGWSTSVHQYAATSTCTGTPTHGTPGARKMEFCATHARDGMVPKFDRKCRHPACCKSSSYGVEGSRGEYCATHAKDGMIDVYKRTCAHQSCRTRPTYGVKGSKVLEFCSRHAKEGMVDVTSRR